MKNKFFSSKLNTALLLVLIILMIIALKWMYKNKAQYLPISNNQNIISSQSAKTKFTGKYIHNITPKFSFSYNKNIVTVEEDIDKGEGVSSDSYLGIKMHFIDNNSQGDVYGQIIYGSDTSKNPNTGGDGKKGWVFLEKKSYGINIVYLYQDLDLLGYRYGIQNDKNAIWIWMKKGTVQLSDIVDIASINIAGPQVEGNKDDLVSFSIKPGDAINMKVEATGIVKGGYFFEGNIVVNILDKNKKLLKRGYGTATTNWMTSGPVSFKTTIDITSVLPAGDAYIEIHNDNASGLPENDKSILIPVVII